jgi:Aspartyl protease
MFSRVISASPLTLALLLAASSGPAHAATARELLAKHADYVGRPAGVVLTYRSDAQPAAAADGAAPAEPPQETTYRRAAAYRSVWRGRGVSLESGFDRRAYWTSNENGYVVTASGEAARRRLTQNIVDAGVFPETAEVSDRGAQTIDGKHVEVLRVTPHGGVAADVALDPADGAYVAVTFAPDDRSQRSTVHVLGYQEIAPAVRVPSAYRYGEGSRYALVQGLVRGVEDDELRAPAATARWSFGGDELPIEFEGSRTELKSVIVRASINGHPGRFLIDSGASQIILYHPYADKLGLTMLGATSFSGIAGRSVPARYARAQTIALGESTLSNVVLVISGDDRDKAGLHAIDGILGFDALAGAVVHVDLVKERLAIGDPATVEPAVGNGAFAFSVNLADNTPEIPVAVGKVTTRATIDTGSSGGVTLSDNLHTSGRLVALGGATSYAIGVDGLPDEPDPCYQLHEVTIGPIRYQNSFVCLGKERVFGRDGGLIGLGFLHHYNWTFDYARKRVVLTPNGL